MFSMLNNLTSGNWLYIAATICYFAIGICFFFILLELYKLQEISNDIQRQSLIKLTYINDELVDFMRDNHLGNIYSEAKYMSGSPNLKTKKKSAKKVSRKGK